MRVTIFGATGKAGRLVVAECLRRGWDVRAFVRNAAGLAPAAGLSVLAGDARSAADVTRAVAGAEAVFSCLGMADITIPATDFSDSVRCIVDALTGGPTDRLIVIGNSGVLPHPAGGYRFQDGMTPAKANIAAEHIRNFEMLRNSSLCWTLMCPVWLKEEIPAGHAKFAYDELPGGSEETGYADLALTMVELVGVEESYRRRVGIVSV